MPRTSELPFTELGDDLVHSVLRYAGPIGLGGAALTCKRLLALVKELSPEVKGTFDRWALAAACAGLGCNSIDRWLPQTTPERLLLVLCENTGRLRRCNLREIREELRKRRAAGELDCDLVGRWGRAVRQNTYRGEYLIPCLIGVVGGEPLRAVIVVDWMARSNPPSTQLVLLKRRDAFQHLSSGYVGPLGLELRSETVSVHLPLNSLGSRDAAELCPLLLATTADPELPALAEMQSLTQKLYSKSKWYAGLWPAHELMVAIRAAAQARLAAFTQLPLKNSASFVKIKTKPLQWLGRADIAQLRGASLWRSGDAPGLAELWEQLEVDGVPIAAAQSLLLRIVRLKMQRAVAGEASQAEPTVSGQVSAEL